MGIIGKLVNYMLLILKTIQYFGTSKMEYKTTIWDEESICQFTQAIGTYS